MDTGKRPTQLWYNDLATLREQHPTFDLDCSLPLEQFAELCAQTLLREDVTCQLEKKGSRCNQPHRNGWLAKRKDGRKCLIGGDCANDNFNASDAFRAEKNRLNHEIAIHDNLMALNSILKDRDALGARIGTCRRRLNEYKDAIKELGKALPSDVVHQLRDLLKSSGDRTRVNVEVRYIEIEGEGKEKKEKISWKLREVGVVIGLSIWDASGIPALSMALNDADSARKEALLAPDQKLTLLKKWRTSLEQLQHAEQAIEQYHRNLSAFTPSANLALLCHLVKNQDRQREVVATILTRSGEQATPMKVQSVLNQINHSVRRANGDRDFRIAY